MIQKPKGTRDLLPQESYIWQNFEKTIENIVNSYGFKEVRLPVFEYTELFLRGVGDTTDVVQKEMYTFNDKGGRSLTLRPEGTAGIVRAYIENGMASMPSPIKMWYNMSMYRYENVQKGRLREFHQIGAEIFGTESYLADIEIITMANEIIKEIGLPDIVLKINSIGCKECRKEYYKVLKEYLSDKIQNYCETCQSRYEKNPMRILDCKEEKCKEYNKNAPLIIDYLCDECREHFEQIKKGLNNLNIKYEIDATIVRGLDYYTKTVFEFVSKKEGYTVLGGGRYDDLVQELGGQQTPAIGFALGVERMIELYKKYNAKLEPKNPKLYLVSIGERATEFINKLAIELRRANIYVEKDISQRSIKAIFKHADKLNTEYVLTIGEDELEKKSANLKEMKTGNIEEISLDIGELIKRLK